MEFEMDDIYGNNSEMAGEGLELQEDRLSDLTERLEDCELEEAGEETGETLKGLLRSDPESLMEEAWALTDDMPEEETGDTLEQRSRMAVQAAATELQVDAGELAEALNTPLRDRTPRQCELTSLYSHHEPFRDQVVFVKNEEDGEIEETGTGRRVKGSQIPDGVYEDGEGYHLLEVKDKKYKGLGPHLREQYDQRTEFFGENTDVLFSLSGGKLTFGEAEALQRYAEKHGINIEFMLK